MQRPDIRPGETAIDLPEPKDAGLVFIGRIHTPWASRAETPKQGSFAGPVCRIEVFALWEQALLGIEKFAFLEVIYWLHLSRRDLVLQRPAQADGPRGTFALRSPVRPNPLGVSRVKFCGLDGRFLQVRGLDCVAGTMLLDIKPERCAFTPVSPTVARA